MVDLWAAGTRARARWLSEAHPELEPALDRRPQLANWGRGEGELVPFSHHVGTDAQPRPE